MENYTQLELDLGIEEVEQEKPKPQILKCKHCIKIKSFKKDYLSYCSKCGKILSVKHKKGE